MVMPWSRSAWNAIEHERPFERHAAALAYRPIASSLPSGSDAGVVEQAADQRRLAVIDMADDDDAERGQVCARVGATASPHM